ncbi:hypothetical protein LCGC14_1470190 [marine sediment metagenome]|uniref:ATPase AAA-type core domain-containing protein n=1 Tax=marine sediment metagenome TaxID=412755 RepID=A0A0F9JYJ0_9ZZZZ
MDKEKLKELLEDTARESGLKIKGEIVEIKTPAQREAEKEFQEWKGDKKEYYIINEFKIPNELLKCLLSTKHYEGLIFTGEGGIGKTILTLSSIKQMLGPDDWEYSNGYTTPLSLYEFLYNNRNKKVIILDDVEGIFNNKLSLAILKGALWDSDGKRICQYSSKSDKAKMPERFVMKANIIILCNHIPKENDASTRAMISRTIFYKMCFSFEQKMKICKGFIHDDKTLTHQNRYDVLEILCEEVNEATRDFNFRTLRKLIAFVQYNKDRARALFQATTEIDELKKVYLEVSRKYDVIKNQVYIFMEKTGKSRRTFFRIKKEISAEVSKKIDIDTKDK